MKKIILTAAISIAACATYAQMFNINGRIENTEKRTRVVMYEQRGEKWDTVYVGKFGKNYSLMLDHNYNYQVWFISSLDSVKVLAVDHHVILDKRFTIDVDFKLRESARIRKGKKRLEVILIDKRLTPANKPEDLLTK